MGTPKKSGDSVVDRADQGLGLRLDEFAGHSKIGHKPAGAPCLVLGVSMDATRQEDLSKIECDVVVDRVPDQVQSFEIDRGQDGFERPKLFASRLPNRRSRLRRRAHDSSAAITDAHQDALDRPLAVTECHVATGKSRRHDLLALVADRLAVVTFLEQLHFAPL